MKPVIGYDIVSNLWSVRHEGKHEMLSAEQLAEKHGIFNPIIYCQQQARTRQASRQGHAKPDVGFCCKRIATYPLRPLS